VPDVYREHYHNVEFHDGHLYVIRRLGYDGCPDEDWADELWRYDSQGQGTRLHSLQGLDFRVAPDEGYIAVTVASEHRLAFLNGSGQVCREYPIEQLSQQDPSRPPAERMISLLCWSDDGKAFWGAIRLGPGAEGFFRVEPATGKVTAYDVSSLPILREYDLNPNSGRVAYSDYPVLLDVDSAQQFTESGQQVTLYVHDLSSGETRTIATSSAKAFRPRWLDDATLEYEDPAGEGRVACGVE
jgi:hypothetical protein